MVGGAQCGKTFRAIQESEKTGAVIVCFCREEACRVGDMANKLGMKIPFPVSIDEALPQNMRGSFYKNLILDNAEMIMERLFHKPILFWTMSGAQERAEQQTTAPACHTA